MSVSASHSPNKYPFCKGSSVIELKINGWFTVDIYSLLWDTCNNNLSIGSGQKSNVFVMF